MLSLTGTVALYEHSIFAGLALTTLPQSLTRKITNATVTLKYSIDLSHILTLIEEWKVLSSKAADRDESETYISLPSLFPTALFDFYFWTLTQ